MKTVWSPFDKPLLCTSHARGMLGRGWGHFLFPVSSLPPLPLPPSQFQLQCLLRRLRLTILHLGFLIYQIKQIILYNI